MTTIKKGTILKEKNSIWHTKVLLVIDNVAFTTNWGEGKGSLIKKANGTQFYTLDYITENYDIVEEDWRPEDLKEGDDYWYLNSGGGCVQAVKPSSEFSATVINYFNYRLKAKNVFPTEQKAKEYKDKIMNS